MISIELVRKDTELFRDGMRRRGEEVPIDRLLELDQLRRSYIVENDSLKKHKNEVSKQLGQVDERPNELIQEMRDIGSQIKLINEQIREVEQELFNLLLEIPNIPRIDVPLGNDESSNVVERTIGEKPKFSFQPRPHWEIGESLGILDLERGAKLSGSRFFVLKNRGARLQRALVSWMLDVHTSEHGYDEIYLPYLVNRKTATGSGHLPKFAETMYHDDEDDLWFIPTAEVPITNLFRDEILPTGLIPMQLVAHTPSFRREKAAAGKDTRGIKRVHQFEKVEMYKFSEPQESDKDLERLVRDAEYICERLGIAYRVIQLCSGDLGFSSAKTYDIEMWAPGIEEWLEVSSCSNCTDFQSRRASIRYRKEKGDRPSLVHTLNGSGLALPRVIIAILENFQKPDGSVAIPEVLLPYTGFDRIQ